ncbi:MAG: endonuclease domain-containing protein [Planctomycetaceae bacterium]|nr:endonuclease domain-containing protein [Planctomycetaceae bacterium]
MNQFAHNLPLLEYLKTFARELRGRATDAETLIWSALRDRRFLKLKFRRQQPIDRYIVDFYCHELKWAVELDGGQHNTIAGRHDDVERTTTLGKHGVFVSRFWNHEVLSDFEDVLESMYRTSVTLQTDRNEAL